MVSMSTTGTVDNKKNDFQQKLIQQVLLDKGVIKPEHIQKALEIQKKNIFEARKKLDITNYSIDQLNCVIIAKNVVTGNIIAETQLPIKKKNKSDYDSYDWFPYGVSNTVVFSDDEDCQDIGEFSWTPEDNISISVSKNSSYLYMDSMSDAYYFPYMTSLPYELFSAENINSLPFDITIPHKSKNIAITDRGAGILYLYDTEIHKLAGAVHLRPSGSNKALNIASAFEGRKFFVTDNQTNALFIVDTKTLKIKRQPLPHGILANITSDDKWLYLLVDKGNQAPELLVLDPQNLIIRATIQLQGQLFSKAEDPFDLMCLSPSRKRILVQTYVNYPTAYTPIVNVIDLENFQWVDQIFMSERGKPSYLSFAINKPNDLTKVNADLIDILIEMGIINEDQVIETLEGIEGPVVERNPHPIRTSFVQMPDSDDNFDTSGFSFVEEEFSDPQDNGTLTSEQKYPVLHKYELDPSLLLAFKEDQMLHFSFLPVNKINGKLTLALANPTHKALLKQVIEQKFPDLEVEIIDFNIIEFKRFMKEFYSVIKEKYQAILASQEAQNAPQEVQQTKEAPKSDLPKNPPKNLKQPLPQNIIKPRTELPPNLSANIPSDVRLAVREKLRSLDPSMINEAIMAICIEDFLNIWGIEPQRKDIEKHKFIIDTARKELLEKDYAFIKIPDLVGQFSLEIVVNQEKLVVMLKTLSEIAQKKQSTPQNNAPTKKLGTTNTPTNEDETRKTTLKCQKCGVDIPPEIDICSKCSRMEAQIQVGDDIRSPASPSPLANLNEGHLLISDITRKRVIELNESGQITWQLGGKDKDDTFSPFSAIRLRSGTTLVTDSDNDRVVEFTKSGVVYWELKDREGFRDLYLRRPIQSIRLLNGNTLIVDQGNHRVFEVNHLDKIVWQYGITATVGCSENKLYSPSYVQRLANGNTLITDTDNHRVIEIDSEDQIVWQYGNIKNKLGSGYGEGRDQLNAPMFATKLENSNVLIVDTGNSRILEITPDKQVAWHFATTVDKGSPINISPFKAYRIKYGHTVIVSSDQIIEIDQNNNLVYIRQIEYLAKSAGFKDASFPGEEHKVISDLVARKGNEKAKVASDNYMKTVSNLSEIQVPLIDRANHRIHIVNRYKNIIWRFGEAEENNDNYLERPQYVELISDEYALVADTDNHRVLKIYRPTKEIVWSYGITGAMGSGNNQLGHPRSATMTPENNVLITDQYSSRVVEISHDKHIVWTFGGWDHGNSAINAPYYAQRLDNNNTLITDWSNHIVIEVNYEGDIVWQYGTTRQSGKEHNKLMYPEKAIRLDNGNTLIADTKNNRIIEINDANKVIWEFINYRVGSTTRHLSNPTNVMRLENGHTVIVDNSNKNIIEVNRSSEVVWQYQAPIERR
jgi:hypothetical protein